MHKACLKCFSVLRRVINRTKLLHVDCPKQPLNYCQTPTNPSAIALSYKHLRPLFSYSLYIPANLLFGSYDILSLLPNGDLRMYRSVLKQDLLYIEVRQCHRSYQDWPGAHLDMIKTSWNYDTSAMTMNYNWIPACLSRQLCWRHNQKSSKSTIIYNNCLQVRNNVNIRVPTRGFPQMSQHVRSDVTLGVAI